MNDGWVFNGGDFYASTEEIAKEYCEYLGYDWEKEKLTVDTDEEWFFWTQWEDIDSEEWYTAEGQLMGDDACICKVEKEIEEIKRIQNDNK